MEIVTALGTSEKVNAEISGSGEVVVTVSGELKVDISGSGTVTYIGPTSATRLLTNPSVVQAN